MSDQSLLGGSQGPTPLSQSPFSLPELPTLHSFAIRPPPLPYIPFIKPHQSFEASAILQSRLTAPLLLAPKHFVQRSHQAVHLCPPKAGVKLTHLCAPSKSKDLQKVKSIPILCLTPTSLGETTVGLSMDVTSAARGP